MKLYILLSFIFCSMLVQTNFLTDAWYQYQAQHAYTASNYDRAGTLYTQLLQQDPYDAQANYNMGLVLYGQKNYETASHYFERAAAHSGRQLTLKEHALFNQGNAYVEQKKLYEAIGSYSKVLEINPKNDRARHNLEYVKQLLQEQQQKTNEAQDKDPRNQSNQDQQKSDQNQEQKNSKSQNQQQQDQQNSSQKDGDGQDQKNKQQSDGNQNQSKDKHNKDASSKKDSDETSKEDVADKLQKSSEAQDKDAQTQSKKNNQSKKDVSDKALAKSDDTKKDALEKAGKSSSQESSNIQGDQEQAVALQDVYADEMQQKPEGDERLDERAVMVMQKLQEQEDHVQKQLLKMNVSKQGAFGYGQKNW